MWLYVKKKGKRKGKNRRKKKGRRGEGKRKENAKEGGSLFYTDCYGQEVITVSTNTGLVSAERADIKQRNLTLLVSTATVSLVSRK